MKSPAFLFFAFLLMGCERDVTLHSRLEERQANLVMATLLKDGISCVKQEGEEGMWNVLIKGRDFAAAASLLEEKGLPGKSFQGIAEAFKKTGMVSSPSEERIRFMDALSQDLAKTISVIAGVIDARVHVVLPENDPFARKSLPSSASVAIRTRWDADLSDKVPAIKNLVKNSIEGLQHEKIAVTLFRDPAPEK